MLAIGEGYPASAEIRQAAAVVAARGGAIDTDRLLDMLDPARPVPVRLAGHRLLAAGDSAWRLAVDVMLLADLEPAVADSARRDLNAALQHLTYVRPSGRTPELPAATLPQAARLDS